MVVGSCFYRCFQFQLYERRTKGHQVAGLQLCFELEFDRGLLAFVESRGVFYFYLCSPVARDLFLRVFPHRGNRIIERGRRRRILLAEYQTERTGRRMPFALLGEL